MEDRPPGRAAFPTPLSRALAVLAGLGLGTIGVACEATRAVPERGATVASAPAASRDDPDAVPGIRIRGGPELRWLTRQALHRVLATRPGARLREHLESGALPRPITIELNLRGDDFTAYRVPGEEIGETVAFDPWTLPSVETERGRLPATRETVLAHELGHAVLKLVTEEEVIREVENPLREELGLPRRVRF